MRNIVWILGLGLLVWIGALANQALAPMNAALHATGARLSGYSVNEWVQVNRPLRLSLLSRRVDLRLQVAGDWTSEHAETYQKLSEAVQVGPTPVRAIVEQLDTGPEFVVLSCHGDHGLAEASATDRVLADTLKGLGPVHSDLNLIGVLPRQLAMSARQALLEHALSAVAAQSISSRTVRGCVVGSGYTPFIARASSRLNIQVAICGNAKRPQTVIYIGSPSVTVGYPV